YVNDLVCSTSSIEEGELAREIQVYPNPANEQIIVSIEKGVLGKVVLYNEIGLKINEIQSNSESIEIDISNLEKGVYFVVLPEKGNTLRFLKQ
ncbi:MAG: T9SS type A sorting domain-containing protein, partial [Bacteroidota bacterium]